MPTLYRKYRPRDFTEVVGQNHIKITLENEIKTESITHAYLFCGPRAVGKTTLARIFSKAVNCLDRKKGDSQPCNKCESCLEISDNRSLDIIEIDAASHTGVDNVRENIIASARVAPSRRKYKIFIVDEVHMLSISAFNALLKVLEEPPANVIFILCTTEIHKVPTTIISRCQRFDFKRISVSDTVKKLKYILDKEKIKADKEVLEGIARQADGHMRDAESLLGQIVAISGKEIKSEEANLVIPRSDIEEIAQLIDILSKKDAASGISLVNKLLDSGVDLDRFTGDLIEVLRKLLLSKISPGLGEKIGADFGESLEMKLSEASTKFEAGRLILILEKFITAKQAIKSSFIVQLPLELAIIELCSDVPAVSLKSPVQNQSRPNMAANSGSPSMPKAASAPSPAPKAGAVQGSITDNELISRWNEFLAKIKKYNHSLSFVLRVCQPRGMNNGRVCLAFKYKFHKDRINDVSIRSLVEKTLAEVYGRNLAFEAILDENMEVAENGNSENGSASAPPADSTKDKGGDMMQDLLDTFGGKVVG